MTGRRLDGRWGGFAAWAAVGVLWTFGLLAILTVGLLFLVLAAIATVLVVRRAPWRAGTPGLAVGASLPLLYVAWLNRDGPGNVCTAIRNGERCTEEMSPWPWIGVAVLLVGGAVYVVARRPRGAPPAEGTATPLPPARP